MVLSVIRLELNEDSKTDVNKLLSSTGEHSNVTVSSGDKRNIAGLLIWHPILLDSLFEEPPSGHLDASPGCAPDAFSFSCAPDTFSLDGVFPYFNLDSKTWFSLFLHGKCCSNPS